MNMSIRRQIYIWGAKVGTSKTLDEWLYLNEMSSHAPQKMATQLRVISVRKIYKMQKTFL
jgi:hypothetical protein